MVDWSNLEETNLEVRRWPRMLQRLLSEAHELGLLSDSLRSVGKLSAKTKTFFKELPELSTVQGGRFVLESALEEKATPTLVAECMIHQLFPRTVYNFALSQKAYLADLLELMEEAEAVSCLAVYRAMRDIGLNNSFVPPAGTVVDKILAEESHLNSLIRDFIRFEKLAELCADPGEYLHSTTKSTRNAGSNRKAIS